MQLTACSHKLAASTKHTHVRRTVVRNTVYASSSTVGTSKAARVQLGQTGLYVAEIGIGAWSWGDRSGYWTGWTKEGSKAAYEAALAAGMDHIDTAEGGLGCSIAKKKNIVIKR
jgi:hypothetical protein